MAPSSRIAIIHGRFQPLHKGHLEYLMAGKQRCDVLIVGISNADPSHLGHEPSDPARSLDIANPCTFYERALMVESALVDEGVSRADFRIVPFPICVPELLPYYVPKHAEYLLTIYDDWGEEKRRRLEHLVGGVHVMWRRDWKFTTGTIVRTHIAEGREWRDLVPPATIRTILEHGIDRRIRDLARHGRANESSLVVPSHSETEELP